MLLILTAWTYIFVTSYLWGASLVSWAFPGAARDHDQPVLLSFVGLSMITIAAGLFSTFAAIGVLFHLLLLSVCLLLLVRDRTLMHPLRTHVRNLRQVKPALLALIAFLFLVALYKASGPITSLDSGAYHLPFIRWVESFRAIPGVANVHSRFGFNYQYLVLCAVYGFAFVYGETIHSLNGYIFCAFLYLMLHPLPTNRPAAQVLSLARLLIALLVANMAFAVTSFSPDFPSAALSILAFLLFVEKVVGDDPLRVDAQTLIIACLSIGAVLFKISAAPALLLNAPGLLGLLQHRPARATAAAALGALCLTPFVARNYILSGYLLYPLYQLDLFNVDWKVPPEIVVREKSLVLHAALGIPLGALWPPPYELPRIWLDNLYTINRSYLPLMLGFAVTLALNLVWIAGHAWTRTLTPWIWPFAYLYVGLAFWLLNGPDPRFGTGYLLPFMALMVALVIPPTTLQHRSVLIQRALWILIFASQAGILVQVNVSKTRFGMPTQSFFGFLRQAPYPVASTTRFADRAGHEYFKVDDSSQCWYAALPCSLLSDRYEFRGLRIEDGFRATSTSRPPAQPNGAGP
jgi:hypothetical protein